MTSHDPETSPRRAARAEAERLATAALTLPAVFDERAPAEQAPTRARRRGRIGAFDAAAPGPRGIRRFSPVLLRRRLVVVVAAVIVVAGCAVAIGAAASGGVPGPASDAVDHLSGPPPVADDGIPVPQLAAVAATATPCDDPAFTAALASGDDAATIAAAGGGQAFRAAVASGIAPCVSLSDPNREWLVVNKQRPYDPVDYQPGDLVMPANVRALEDSAVRAPAAAALTSLVKAASDAGVGEIGYLSAYRSYTTQKSTYAGRVAVGGVAEADRESARPGFSEHQSGMAVDIVPCNGSCRTLDDVAGSPQGAWVREHAWEYGFITRYAEGRESVSGYEPEAWHLRYIGPELARAYHEGGFTTLEEFFGLPAAPTY
ncbi:D-alanyl-D-alanine carboxypeptidase [Microbacterium sp. AG157]|uniref:D-alanyl-D-alanine carboxypeptidase family protein n=1 Tax=Microbacterium sp. AG157 TaxID=2183993 RepID=UPI000E3AB044|nr:D-alanyl-D-alanine carboxypeptidase family protein [Microbacterium sp. AG157]RED00019.1 D-alanyl-D-alanine carboxypeptidase [Microbacterium sp. AG157]